MKQKMVKVNEGRILKYKERVAVFVKEVSKSSFVVLKDIYSFHLVNAYGRPKRISGDPATIKKDT